MGRFNVSAWLGAAFFPAPGSPEAAAKRPCRGPLLPLLLLLFFLVPAAPGAHAEELRFGMSAAFSGPTRGLGIEYYRGLSACFNYVNSRGGVHGNILTIVPMDDGYDPEPCVSNTIELVQKYNVFALLNYVGTPTTTRMLPLLKRFENRSMYLLFPLSGAEPLRTPPYGQFVYNLRTSYFDEVRGLVDHLVAAGRTRIAVFYQADAYGRNGWDGVRRALADQNLTMAGEAAYRRGTNFSKDFTTEARLIAEHEPDAVIIIGSYAASSAFIRDARNAGLDVPLCSVSFSDADNMLNLLSIAGRESGTDYTEGVIFSQVVPSYEDVTLPAVRRYRALMGQWAEMPPERLLREPYQNREYSMVSFEGFLNGELLVAMLERMGPEPDPERIPEVMRSLDDFDLGLGVDVHFDDTSNQGLQTVYYAVARGGRLVPLRTWKEFAK